LKFDMLCSAVLLASAAFAAPARTTERYSRTVSYAGQSVQRCTLHGVSAENRLAIAHHFDMMTHTADYVDVRIINADDAATLASMVPTKQCKTVVEDVEAMVLAAEKDLNTSHANAAEWFDEYHTYDEIIAWYEDVASDYERITKWVPRVGVSYGGLDMPALHITGEGGDAKAKVWFQCSIHSREWISNAVCQYIVDYLVSNYGINDEVTNLLNTVELVIMPFVNPDGYKYTWSGERLWRKNRQPNPGSNCVGTDLNRNYNDKWGTGGGSTNPCSETYEGARAASAPETIAAQEYFLQNTPINGAIDWHAYSQLVLRPYGWTQTDAPDEGLLKECGDLFRDEAAKPFGTKFTSQKSIGLYPTTGTANDWFYSDDANVGGRRSTRAYGFTIELRDTGRYGFQLPASQIIPSGQEMIPAAISFMNFVRDNALYYPDTGTPNATATSAKQAEI